MNQQPDFQRVDTCDWRALAEFAPAQRPGPPLDALLRERGSMTGVLRARCQGHFALRLLTLDRGAFAAYQAGALAADTGLLREVLMVCGDVPWVFAQSFFPDATVGAHPWLARLDAQPLGDRLFARADVTRSEFSYARLEPNASLNLRCRALLDAPAETSLWARRSYFEVAQQPLLVNEVFLPGLSAWTAS